MKYIKASKEMIWYFIGIPLVCFLGSKFIFQEFPMFTNVVVFGLISIMYLTLLPTYWRTFPAWWRTMKKLHAQKDLG